MHEKEDEGSWVRELLRHSHSYLDVYDKVSLMRPRAVHGHCILARQRRIRTHCGRLLSGQRVRHLEPVLGSGPFDFECGDSPRTLLSLGTDDGTGTAFSMLQTMNEAYKVARLKGSYLPALRMFYLATLGAARSMGLSDTIGSFAPGLEADVVVLDPQATPLLARRTSHCDSLEELLFALALLGDDRSVAVTYSAGREVHRR